MNLVAAFLFHTFGVGRCPCCGRVTRFSQPVPVAVGVPPEMEHLVPRVAKCAANGCTSSVRAITGLELRTRA